MWTEEKFNEMKTQLFNRASEDMEFRNKCLNDPNEAIKEISGMYPPKEMKINFISEEAGVTNVVLPAPKKAGELTEESLLQVAGGAQYTTNLSGSMQYPGGSPTTSGEKIQGVFWSWNG